MDFLIKYLKPVPSDDSLLNMLLEDCEHLPIDNQVTQLLWHRPDWFCAKALKASAQHVEFTNLLAEFIPTVHVMTGQKLNDTMDEKTWDLFAEPFLARHLPITRVDYNPQTLQALPNPCGRYFVDLLNPEALTQRIYMKTENSAYSQLNTHHLKSAFLHKEAKAKLVTGFFANLCTKATEQGARQSGYRTIYDPEMCYDEMALTSISRQQAFRHTGRMTILTEPGQVSHVMQTYKAKNNPLVA